MYIKDTKSDCVYYKTMLYKQCYINHVCSNIHILKCTFPVICLQISTLPFGMQCKHDVRHETFKLNIKWSNYMNTLWFVKTPVKDVRTGIVYILCNMILRYKITND